jgi:hypothetical protein
MIGGHDERTSAGNWSQFDDLYLAGQRVEDPATRDDEPMKQGAKCPFEK